LWRGLALSPYAGGDDDLGWMPNFIWIRHEENGLGMVFATQLLTVDDEKTVELAMDFFSPA
jgi:hypothetical protein